MDGWTHSSTGTRVSPTDPCPQTHPCPRCRVPSSFREEDNAKPPALAQPKGHKAGHREHSLAAECPLHGHREPCPPAQDTPADPITGAWSPHTGAGGVIEAAAVPHTPQQLKIARRKEINSRRSPARSHQPNQHRLCSLCSPSTEAFIQDCSDSISFPHHAWLEGDGNSFHPQCHPPVTSCRREGWMSPHVFPHSRFVPQLHGQQSQGHCSMQAPPAGTDPRARPGGFVHPPRSCRDRDGAGPAPGTALAADSALPGVCSASL